MLFLQVLPQNKFEQIHWCTLLRQEMLTSMLQMLFVCSVAGHCTACSESDTRCHRVEGLSEL